MELLTQIGIHCEILPADIDESALTGEPPAEYVLRLARLKAEVCMQNRRVISKPMPVIGADTTVELNGMILGKPNDEQDAKRMLQALSGQIHQVHTAVALAWKDGIETLLSTTRVAMMPLSDGQIDAYIRTGESRDKAGSYGIQGLAGAWVRHIEGSYTGVMGLPVYETACLLRAHGLVAV